MDWSETVRKAHALTGVKGYITFDQLHQMLPPNVRSEDLEILLSTLSDNGILVQDE
ncbi:MAG: RNA polymerase subunit sigma-70 [Bradyrhizobium sp.]|uniref:RNA polymerase sigma factor region1.1 domain-containing protein n=1 Tax=Bradyrhizobium sp. TaxID=376 RepID=UPI001C288B97|nr:RNA polymerase sigma factor region1.1 domain-containing protein [Bradyrhizobium sp.]MBU6462248.1 RNA polymerase subunit sigma-70 [Pseudomonadota bacterium]MDE2067301.1 RNA polymerase subunit sigma-70 [Bradyrhizobium sp.]MDE2243276.1 RNA polymerase subunit sigma-70 [Bradyrhizobium sp.]MDE2471949.1 RNA polymerase subunit sigma-70 [Bradyrhizobium sp.]